MFNISGLNKAKLLVALYNQAWHNSDTTLEMTVVDAQQILALSSIITMLGGKTLLIDLSGDFFNPFAYDSYNGVGSAAAAIASVSST